MKAAQCDECSGDSLVRNAVCPAGFSICQSIEHLALETWGIQQSFDVSIICHMTSFAPQKELQG